MSIESAYYVEDKRGFAQFIATDVAKHLRKIGQQIQRAARRQVGVDTGRLRASIHVRQGADIRGQFVEVGSPLDHAYVHHEGQRPHTILPETGRYLRFQSGGRVVYTRRVEHPGTRPNHYLTEPMTRVVLTD